MALRPEVRRNDVVTITGADLHAAPASVRPALNSDACWASVPLCHLRRGDCIRAEASASLMVGATHSRAAPACGGVSVVVEDGVCTLDLEPVGQLGARALLLAAVDAFVMGVEQYARGIQLSYEDRPPPPHYPARAAAARRRTPQTSGTAAMAFECTACGAVSKQHASCHACGRSVLAKLRRQDAVLRLY